MGIECPMCDEPSILIKMYLEVKQIFVVQIATKKYP